MENIKLVTFDIDGTLVEGNSWYVLNSALGITPAEDAEMFAAYAAGMLSYADWTEKLLNLYKTRGKATKDTVAKVLKDISVSEEAKELVQYLKAKGYELGVLSGSFDILANQIADELGIVHRKGNARLVFDESGALIALENDGEEKYAKLEHLKAFADQIGIALEECACIGDGSNDIETFKATKHGITFSSATDETKQAAWKVVDSLKEVQRVL